MTVGALTKQDLDQAVAGLATKDELHRVVVKEDLDRAVSGFASKDEVRQATSSAITRQDLDKAVTGIMTKEVLDLKAMKEEIDRAISELSAKLEAYKATPPAPSQTDLENTIAGLATKDEIQQIQRDLSEWKKETDERISVLKATLDGMTQSASAKPAEEPEKDSTPSSGLFGKLFQSRKKEEEE